MNNTNQKNIDGLIPINATFDQIIDLVWIIFLQNMNERFLTITEIQKMLEIYGYELNRKTVEKYIRNMHFMCQNYKIDGMSKFTIETIKIQVGIRKSEADGFCLIDNSIKGIPNFYYPIVTG